MHLSKQGILADVFWHEIKNRAKNVDLDEFTVMPNHIHGILMLNNTTGGNDDGTGIVEARHALSLQCHPPQQSEPPQTIGQQRFQNQGKNSLSSVVGSYKSAVTKHCNRLGLEFAWQSRFHEHIISNAAEYQRIKSYIANNPFNWKDDKFYKR
ncbi:MAG: hypothetical protein KF746_13045 [Chitinophagaceae bacterium]|nr:hypothetical protein [Chitinophagaceae bacterium]